MNVERWPIVVDGKRRVPSGDGDTPIMDPATGELIGRVGHASEADATDAISAADHAFRRFRHSTPAERAELLLRLALVMEGAAEELAAIETRNVGMPLTFARATVMAAVDATRYFAGAARTLTGPVSGEYVRGMMSLLRREPVGVVTAFIPWNVPLLMAIWKIAPALAAGNAMVIKPSIRTPASLLRLLELADDILPAGLLNCVTGEHGTVAPVLAGHPDVAMVALTGSLAAGATVGSLAAPTAKRLHLELGGKTPVLVCSDAEVDVAAETIVRAALDNAGQDCTAASRILVDHQIQGALIDGITARLDSIAIGDPRHPATDLGPVIARDRRSWLCAMVDQASQDGARLVRGGLAVDGPGAFMTPALLADVPAGSRITQIELFGPVISVEACRDVNDMVARANGTPYALAAGIWTRSSSRALRLAAAIDAGKVWVNEHHRDVTEMPHGGRKSSGHGSDLSTLALEAYTAPKAIHIAFDLED